MAGRRYGAGVAALCLALLAGCGGPAWGGSEERAVQRLLDVRARAVLDRDERAYRGTEEGPAREDPEFRNLAEVPLTSWTYRLTRLESTGSGRARARAELGYRLRGYDRAPLTAIRTLDLRRHGGRWYVTGERSAGPARQFWEQGAVDAVRGARSLVLGVGQSGARLREFARLADAAVPRATRAWGDDWRQRVVVLVPRSPADMAGLLGAEPSVYRGIAAVTTGEVGGTGRAPADRVIVNPEAFGLLGETGRQVVMTHETTHVATRTRTTASTPLWLSEGFADWAGYRGTGRSAPEAAPELTRAVREGRLPRALPADADFGFGREAGALAEAYEGGWLACRLIAERWGLAQLREFYRAVGAHDGREGAVAAALDSVLGLREGEFTRQWQSYLRAELGGE
ncbi:hypothetical protein ABZ929_08075 [Streptomyces physcomitrii]|uniref:hypothetical protein n=1 Tax=Streptomyces physcomitrii TaxID=2724184 RepID=UPI0033FA1DFA